MEDDEAGVERSDLRGRRAAVEDGLWLGASSSRCQGRVLFQLVAVVGVIVVAIFVVDNG